MSWPQPVAAYIRRRPRSENAPRPREASNAHSTRQRGSSRAEFSGSPSVPVFREPKIEPVDEIIQPE